MSFSSDVKKQIAENGIKRDCCKICYERGKALEKSDFTCERDLGIYLRGIFMKCGSISPPGRNFMLSFVFKDQEMADFIYSVLDTAGFPPKVSSRRGKPLLYYKASESIEDILSLIGGTKAALDIISAKVLSDVRNNTNRLCNAETANLDRTAKAAAEQCEAIKIIQKFGLLQNLPPELRECAELRLANPDMSLAQLRLLLSEPVSKSGLNHRFRKLIELSEAYKT